MEQFIPTNNQIFVIPIQEETKGSITLPESCRNSLTGKVTAVGCDIKEVKVNDIILYGNQAFNNFRSREGQKFFIMDERNVVAILEE